MRKKIGFISDTHGGIDETLRALEVLKDCEIIYHLGDVLYHGPRTVSYTHLTLPTILLV